ncbi:MAG: hypothetical protein N2376_09985, partial [Clostridia bacterium]|nr:hypothetical protein [Clostridia bacterium]
MCIRDSTYSFPKGALRMRWLEEKEQPRAAAFFGEAPVYPATTVLLTLDGVPHIMMGQEFNEKGYRNWSSLFDGYKLDWKQFDEELFHHFRSLIALRNSTPAFSEGSIRFVVPPGERILGYIREWQSDKYLVLASLDKGGCSLDLPALLKDEHACRPVLLYQSAPLCAKGNDTLLAPFESRVYRLY